MITRYILIPSSLELVGKRRSPRSPSVARTMHAFNIITIHDLVDLMATSGRVTVSNLDPILEYLDAFVGISGEQCCLQTDVAV